VELSQPNNATRPAAAELRFGIRVSAPPEDPFARLVDAGWQAEHWYATRAERDGALSDMGARHRYSRIGDVPSVVLEAIER
jgi:hypothetical protein